jgi:hypothetical protein
MTEQQTDLVTLIEGKYTYELTFNEVMKDDTYDSIIDPTELFFRGTPRLKKALNQVKFLYKRGYRSGITRIFRYGFSINQHQNYLQIGHIEQARFTVRSGTTPEQKEEVISSWSNTTRLCPDLNRGVPINLEVKKEISKAVTDNAEIIGISKADMAIVMIYTALLRCDGLDPDVIEEGNRFVAAFNNAVRNRAKILQDCGGI